MKSKNTLRAFLLGCLACSATAHADTYTWTRTMVQGTTNNHTWSSGTNWSLSAPVSGSTTTLTFNLGLAFATETNNLSNDIATANPDTAFQLNILNLNTTGTLPTSGNLRTGTVNITGNPLNVVADSGNNPVVNLNANQSTNGSGERVTYAVQSNIVLDANTTFTGDGTANFNLSGAMSGNSGVTVTKSGTSTLILSGTSTYTGKYNVTAGTLQFTKMVSLYNNTPASWTPENINVNSGGTFAVNVDSAGTAGFDATNLNTLLSNISVANSSTTGLQAGALIGIDTSTASGSSFTQGDAIADSTDANGGAIGLTKLGAGTLILDKSNTYTGTTTINSGGGTLQIGNGSTAGSISSTSSVITNANVTFSRSDDVTVGNVISGAGSVTKVSAGKLTLTGPNTYTGVTTIGGGTLSVSSISDTTVSAQPLGSNAIIQLGLNAINGTLEFTGNTNSTNNRQFRIGNPNSSGQFSNGIILNNGTGSLTFTNAFFNSTTAGQNATRTITLGGTYSGGFNEIQGAIRNATAAGTNPFNALTVSGSKWKLSGTNTYTGATSVTAGTLLINGSTSTSSAVAVSSEATLGGTGTIGGNTTIAHLGKLTFDLSTAPGSHDKLDIDTGKLTFSGDSVLTITSSSGATTGLYTLVTAAGGIDGSAPAPTKVDLPVGWTADAPQIVGNDLKINITSTGSGLTGYALWASTNATSGNADDDFDDDGVSNAVEYVLGGLASTKDLGKLPGLTTTPGGDMLFTFDRDQDSIAAGTTVTIEVSTDLVNWTNSPSPYAVPDGATGPVNPGITVLKDTSPGFDTVTLSVPQSPDTKKFARLKVVIAP